MFQIKVPHRVLAVCIVLSLSIDSLVGAEAPGDGRWYSDNGGYENNCPISVCQTDCNIGYYRSGCSGNSSGSCVPCGNKPANADYSTKGLLISDCSWACSNGFIQSGSTCVENTKCTKSIPQNAIYSNAAFPNCDHQCNAGYFNAQTSTNPTSCDICQTGSYSLQGSTTCTVCPVGTFSTVVGSPSAVNCQECPIGTYSANTGASLSTVCINCQAGTYSTAAGGGASSTCHPCPEGTSSASIGAISASVCSSCAAGKYTNTTGNAVCVSCIAGTYASGIGSSKCVACSLNSYAPVSGMVSCTPCEYCITPGIYRTGCGPVSAGYCTVCTNSAV